ncbi:MAG: type II toxin-antitoxin system RelE family toxin [Tepidisphaeraceae bacterium]
MWVILEHSSIKKACSKAPDPVVRKYELWKNIVFRHGPEKSGEFPGFGDEKLKGRRAGQRSSRLSLQYRVIYAVDRAIVTVFVLEVTPHKY